MSWNTVSVCKAARLLSMVFVALVGMATASAQAQQVASARGAVVQMDRPTLQQHLHGLGYRRHGSVPRSKSESTDARYHALPHFSSAFSVGGVSYTYTMLGTPPASGQTTRLKAVIVPLRMNFVGFGSNGDLNVTFDPTAAVNNILHSPIFHDAPFLNGTGQFGEMMQRATFWNRMDHDKAWRVRMSPPRVMRPIDLTVTSELGTLTQSNGAYFGDVLISFIDAEAQTIVALTGIAADEVPIFVTQNVTAEALGYHEAYSTAQSTASETLQTLIYTSWLDPALVDPLIADVSTINHEIGEWLNDPFTNNVVPTWAYPPASDPASACSGSNVLEVGDPEGNGPTFADFPTYVVTLGGVDYHLQDLVMLPWFADEVPSTAYNGWYDFPAANLISAPAVYCP